MPHDNNDDVDWLEEDLADSPKNDNKLSNKWRILIVDDEADVHAVTRLFR